MAERHWYSPYPNLDTMDPEQMKLRDGNVVRWALLRSDGIREKLPAPPPSTPNYSARPEVKPAAVPLRPPAAAAEELVDIAASRLLAAPPSRAPPSPRKATSGRSEASTSVPQRCG